MHLTNAQSKYMHFISYNYNVLIPFSHGLCFGRGAYLYIEYTAAVFVQLWLIQTPSPKKVSSATQQTSTKKTQG